MITLSLQTEGEEEMQEPPQKQYFSRSNVVPGPLGGRPFVSM